MGGGTASTSKERFPYEVVLVTVTRPGAVASIVKSAPDAPSLMDTDLMDTLFADGKNVISTPNGDTLLSSRRPLTGVPTMTW